MTSPFLQLPPRRFSKTIIRSKSWIDAQYITNHLNIQQQQFFSCNDILDFHCIREWIVSNNPAGTTCPCCRTPIVMVLRKLCCEDELRLRVSEGRYSEAELGQMALRMHYMVHGAARVNAQPAVSVSYAAVEYLSIIVATGN
jgi:hypothetical protein